MLHFLLMYDVVPEYLERREPHRAAHLALARQFQREGRLVLGGALAEPADGAVLLFTGVDSSVAEEFARADPYVRHGVVTAWRVRRWMTVVGDLAAHPVA